MGFCGIGLYNIVNNLNIGGSLRAASAYEADFIAITGRRYKHMATDTTKVYRHIPLLEVDDIMDALPYSCVPIGIEICDKAKPIYNFCHPKQAYYIFGPEDGSINPKTLDECKYILYIPTKHCMNLAATVNVVLYDRLLKMQQK
jgi:tRNA(Leu) C34 or U34 (ribose-2'-O)-methylase TrmL